MSALLALVATVLTSFLPILNKRLLRDATPARVTWAINAASLPLLAVGTFLLTQCSIVPVHGIPLSCTTSLPHIDDIFVVALLASAALNWAATLLSTYALARADAFVAVGGTNTATNKKDWGGLRTHPRALSID